MTSPWPVTPYVPRHPTWPYTDADFTRHDNSSDAQFYHAPRLVTHIDDAAIATLRQYYDAVLPRSGRLLDFCSSWISHYPDSVALAAKQGNLTITGMGMNAHELDANPVLSKRITTDLNADPDVRRALTDSGAIDNDSDKLAASTCVVSIDYLTHPRQVLSSLRSATKPGGTVHLVISNRCFPTKAIGRWLRVDEGERLLMVGDYLHFSGWREIEIVELSDGRVVEQRGEKAAAGGGGLAGLMRFVGVGLSRDPLWVVRATKTGGD